jgi:hypothetical protein
MASNHRSTIILTPFLLCSLSLIVELASAGCFLPDGTDRNVEANATYPYEYYSPCNNQTGVVSMCCAIGPARLADYPDTCSSNGLCLSEDGTWWRESCTDPTWKDPACVQLYVNGSYNGQEGDSLERFNCSRVLMRGSEATIDVPMSLCPDGSYCMGTGAAATPCCDNHQGLFVLSNLTVTSQNPNLTASATSSSASSTTLASSTSSLAFTATPPAGSPTATASPLSRGLSTGAKAGIGIGAAVAALAILGLVFWVFILRRSHARGRSAGEKPDLASSAPPPPPSYDPPKEKFSSPIYETYGTPVSGSAPHSQEPVEMEQPGAQIPQT